VAKIVAETMNNHLMFGHILKVAVVPPEKLHPKMFPKKPLKIIPHRKIEILRRKKVSPFLSAKPNLYLNHLQIPSFLG